MSDWIRLLVKFKGKCIECKKEILAGEYALWSKDSKAIKHVKCKTQSAEMKEEKPEVQEVQELECFICGRQAGCSECGFEANCNRQVVSQACICSQCLDDRQAYANYRRAFVEKARKVAKVKIE